MSVSRGGDGGTDAPAFVYDQPPMRALSGRKVNQAAIGINMEGGSGSHNGVTIDTVDAEDLFPVLDNITEALAVVIRKINLTAEVGDSTAGEGDWFLFFVSKNADVNENPMGHYAPGGYADQHLTLHPDDDTYFIYDTGPSPNLQASGVFYEPLFAPSDPERQYLFHLEEDDTLNIGHNLDGSGQSGQGIMKFEYEVVSADDLHSGLPHA